MNDEIPDIADNPKAALVSFITELETFYLSWYESATTRNYYSWFVAQAISLLAGFATAVVAAFVHGDQLNQWGWRGLLIALPLLGSLASTYLLQSRVAEMETLRETGRETVQSLANEARVNFAAAKTPEEYTHIHRALVAAIRELEIQQRQGFQRIAPKVTTFNPPADEEAKGPEGK